MAFTQLRCFARGKGHLARKPADIAVEAAKHSRKLQIEGRAQGNKEMGKIASRSQRRLEFRCQYKAMLYDDKVMAALGHEADSGFARVSAPGVQDDPSAARAMGVGEG